MPTYANHPNGITGALALAVFGGEFIPAHDETADIAETIAGFLNKFRDYVEDARDHAQADDALAELGRAIYEATGNTAGTYACAECGTTTARSYVVTTLDYENERDTRTEACLDCHEKLTTTETEGLPALVYSEQATDSYLDHVASMRGWNVTVTTTDGEKVEGALDGAGYPDATHVASIYLADRDLPINTEDVRQVFIH